MASVPFTPTPTQADWLANFVYGVMGVPTAWLPSGTPTIFYAYNTAVSTVNTAFACVPGPIYLQMIYNLAGHQLATWAPDPTWAPGPVTGAPPLPFINQDGKSYGFWQWLRKENNVTGFITGTVQSSSDEGTSVGLVVPKQAENLTIGQMQLTTTIWGRTYLGLAQSYGSPWGMS